MLFKSKTGKLRYEVHKRIFANSAPSTVVTQPGDNMSNFYSVEHEMPTSGSSKDSLLYPKTCLH